MYRHIERRKLAGAVKAAPAFFLQMVCFAEEKEPPSLVAQFFDFDDF